MAVPLTRERRRELTREALLDAATTVFAHRGYLAGTLEEIAAAAGFTQGAIYSNFANKQELFLAVVERRNARLLAAYHDAIREDASDGPVDPTAITRVWTEHELHDDNALLLTLEIRLAALRDPALRVRLGEFERQTEQAIATFIERQLQAVGATLPMPVERFAALVYAGNQGIWQHVAICTSDHADLFQSFIEAITRVSARRATIPSP